MKTIAIQEVLRFHKNIIEKTGGSDGIRDYSLIDSALNRAFATFDGKDLYESVIDKIAAVTTSLIKNHGFIDGNKRIGVAVMLLLLKLNHIKINYTQSDLIKFGLSVASGKLHEQEVKQWIEKHKVNKA